MLPNESLLQMLHFVDYKTLVHVHFAGRRFLRLTIKFAEQLARRHSFQVFILTSDITYFDTTIHTLQRIRYEPGEKDSLAAACQELAGVIGPHAVAELAFYNDAWTQSGVHVIFEAAPPLKYAEEVGLDNYDPNLSTNSEAFLSNFAGIKTLCLSVDANVFHTLNWTFLRQESARGLLRIKFNRRSVWPENMDRSILQLVHHCATDPHVLDGQALELDFSENRFSGAFVRQVIELLKISGREVTFRMRTQDELMLDESDYTVDVDGYTTRYASEKSGILIEVKGPFMAVRSTAEGPPKKQRRRTNEQV